MAAGKAGGTVIVIKSNDLSIRLPIDVPFLIIIGSVQAKPTIEINAMIATNFMPS
jgi:hypothetical protein